MYANLKSHPARAYPSGTSFLVHCQGSLWAAGDTDDHSLRFCTLGQGRGNSLSQCGILRGCGDFSQFYSPDLYTNRTSQTQGNQKVGEPSADHGTLSPAFAGAPRLHSCFLASKAQANPKVHFKPESRLPNTPDRLLGGESLCAHFSLTQLRSLIPLRTPFTPLGTGHMSF